MRKVDYFSILILFLLMVLVAGKTSFSWQCVGPAYNNCLQCHAGEGGGTSGSNPQTYGYLHEFHEGIEGIACGDCHCGEGGTSPCTPSFIPVDTHCCTTCHDGCVEVDDHTSNLWYDCASCHDLFDADADGFSDCLDNCPQHPNGPDLGLCAQTECGVYRYSLKKCTSDTECIEQWGSCWTCLINQEDNYPLEGNGTGDACEWCYTDFGGDGKVFPDDAMVLLGEWKRKDCSGENPCQADINGDGKVFPDDAMVLLTEWKRKDCPVLP